MELNFQQQIEKYFSDNIKYIHRTEEEIPRSSRGLRFIGPTERIQRKYLYMGDVQNVVACIKRISEIPEPVCIISSGMSDYFTDDNIPDMVYLIAIDMEFASLYNQLRECIHHYRIIESPAESIHVNKDFEHIVEEIIECRLTDESQISKKLADIRINIGECYRLNILEFCDSEITNAIAWNFIITRLEEIFPQSCICLYGNTILIIEKNVKLADPPVEEGKILPLLKQFDCYLGGQNFGYHLNSLSAMFAQAQAGIKFGLKINPDKRIFRYEDYALFQIVEFALESSGRLMKTRNPIYLCNIETVTLMKYDAENHDNLMNVLCEYLRHNCNVCETAKDLFIHRNTMNNKLRKIEDIIGKTLDDPKFLDRLRFSCAIYEYIKVIKNN